MTIKVAAAKAAMSESCAHKYLRSGEFPSELKKSRAHRTRVDAFAGVWAECLGYLDGNPGLEVRALFAHLQGKYPGQFESGQLQTPQRRGKQVFIKRRARESSPDSRSLFIKPTNWNGSC
jgi:hypothetical protein